jgi:transcription antitermination factor NusG
MIDRTTKQWYAVKTKYKCEKYVVEQIQKKGVEAYVPLLARTRRYTRKVKHYNVPLINCYAFVRIEANERIAVLKTQYVIGFLEFAGEALPIPDSEMDLMRRVVGEMADVTADPTEWIPGDEVEVISGNLTGLKGLLAERKGKSELVVVLESIGYQLRVEIDERMLRRVGSTV